VPEISTRPAAWVAHTYSNTQVSTEHGVVGGFMRESGPGLVHGYTRAAGLAVGQVAGGTMTTLNERPGVREQLEAEDEAWRATGCSVKSDHDFLAELDRLARQLYAGDPAEGRPLWAVRSEDTSDLAGGSYDTRIVCHYGPTASIQNSAGEPEVITVHIEQRVDTTATGETRDTYVNLGRCETINPEAVGPLAAALLAASAQLDAAAAMDAAK